MDCKRSAIVHECDRDDPVRFAVIVTRSIAADRGNTAIPLLDCITSELETRFSAICNKASKLLFLVPSIVVQDEFNSDVNNIIGIYEQGCRKSGRGPACDRPA